MSSEAQAPVVGAVTGLAVAAAIVGQSALASNGGSSRHPAAKPAAKAAAQGATNPFVAVVAQAVQAGTIDAAQARVLDAHILAGSMDPDAVVAAGVLSAAQMQTVNDRLIAVKKGLASQAHGGAIEGKPAPPAQVSCATAGSGRGKAAG
jgi:hypothetical protein